MIYLVDDYVFQSFLKPSAKNAGKDKGKVRRATCIAAP